MESKEYVELETLKNMINALPVAEFNNVQMFAKNRVLKMLGHMPRTKNCTTEILLNDWDVPFCANCGKHFNPNIQEISNYTYCPFCGAFITYIEI